MSNDLLIGWLLGLVSSLLSGVVLFWLQGRRDQRNETLRQRREDTRTTRNWASDGKKVSLRDFDLRGANLSGKDLSGADLERANMESAGLWATNLAGANLRAANFRKARIKGADFQKAMLLLADFTDATIVDTDFSEAILRRAKLNRVKTIENCLWRDVHIDDTTELSSELKREIERQAAAIKVDQAQAVSVLGSGSSSTEPGP